MQKTLTFKLRKEESRKLLFFLQKIGQHLENTNEYVDWHVKGEGFSGVMYLSGKFVLQVSNPNIEKKIVSEISKDDDFKPHIGSDEVGKGDYFGPLVVCACYVSSKDLEKLGDLGVRDSKNFKDFKILELGSILKDFLEYEVKIISPVDYNEQIEEFKNVAIVLAKAHSDVATKLLKDLVGKGAEVDSIVIDQFSKSKNRLLDEFNVDVPIKQFHGGESDIVVAAASILARYFFLLEFEEMRKEYDFNFPLGATHVIPSGKTFVEKFGFDELQKVAKVSFKTTKDIQR